MTSIETIVSSQPKTEKPNFKELPEHQELNLDGIESVPLPWEHSKIEDFLYLEIGQDGKKTDLKRF